MNLSSLFGILASLLVFGVAVLTATDNMLIFLDWHAALIVFGGTLAASLVCFSWQKVLGLVQVFAKRMLGTNRKDYGAIISDLSMLSDAMRSGMDAYEQTVPRVRDPFLRDASQVLFWLESDISEAQLRDLLETRAKTHFNRYMQEADYFRTMAKFPPAFGLLGTTLGMIVLLQSLSSANARDIIGPAMSIALVATLYGIVLANFVLIPIAENLTKQTYEDLTSREMVIEGIMLIQADLPTKYVVEKVKSYLLPSERKTSGENDSLRRGA